MERRSAVRERQEPRRPAFGRSPYISATSLLVSSHREPNQGGAQRTPPPPKRRSPPRLPSPCSSARSVSWCRACNPTSAAGTPVASRRRWRPCKPRFAPPRDTGELDVRPSAKGRGTEGQTHKRREGPQRAPEGRPVHFLHLAHTEASLLHGPLDPYIIKLGIGFGHTDSKRSQPYAEQRPVRRSQNPCHRLR